MYFLNGALKAQTSSTGLTAGAYSTGTYGIVTRPPNANKAIYEVIQKNAVVPDSVKNGVIPGNVFCTLKIDSTGAIIGQTVLSPCAACRIEAIRLLKLVPKFEPALEKNRKVSGDMSYFISFAADPESLLVYKPEYLNGYWTVEGESNIRCFDCPVISFGKNGKAILIKDSLEWIMQERKLTIINRGSVNRKADFVTPGTYLMKFSEYFNKLVLDNGKEKYILYKFKR